MLLNYVVKGKTNIANADLLKKKKRLTNRGKERKTDK